MSNEIASHHCWLFNSPRGELRAGMLCGQVDVSRPELGIWQLAMNGHRLSGRIFSVLPCRKRESSPSPPTDDELLLLPPRQLADAYVRGRDLVATYQATDAWPYAMQIYWQASEAVSGLDVLSSASLLVSLQTHLLDAWPTMCVDTRLAADELVHLDCTPEQRSSIHVLPRGTSALHTAIGACCILYRLTGIPMTYVEMMPSSDMREVTVWRGEDGTCHVRWELFSDFLEKGVIRRARMQSIVVPRAGDAEAATVACRAMQRRPLPLTT